MGVIAKRLLVLWLVAACEHRPAPPQPQTTAPADAATVAPVGADACMQIGVNIAEVIISGTADPTQKAAYEQERTRMVKRFSENCTREKWPDPIKSCFLAAKTQADADHCSRELAKALAGNAPPAPPPAPPPPPPPPPPTNDAGLKPEPSPR